MRLISTVAEMKATCRQVTRAGRTLGLVPTMGALHAGHLSLVRASKARCNATAVSIFVNPLQFGPTEDLHKYPRMLERDAAMLEEAGVDFLFAPPVEEMYAVAQGGAGATQVIAQQKGANLGHRDDGVDPSASSGQALGGEEAQVIAQQKGANLGHRSETYVVVEGLSEKLDGASRPGHFRGVTTVVAKLFEIVRPDCAFFGQKDAAQVAVLRKMVRDLDMDVEIVVCPIVREKDGLAMSSRNAYLTAEQRQQALVLHRALMRVQTMADRGERDAKVLREIGKQVIAEEPGARLDYFEIVDPDTLDPVDHVKNGALVAVAAYVGTTRLIDNILLT